MTAQPPWQPLVDFLSHDDASTRETARNTLKAYCDADPLARNGAASSLSSLVESATDSLLSADVKRASGLVYALHDHSESSQPVRDSLLALASLDVPLIWDEPRRVAIPRCGPWSVKPKSRPSSSPCWTEKARRRSFATRCSRPFMATLAHASSSKPLMPRSNCESSLRTRIVPQPTKSSRSSTVFALS